MQKGNLVTGTGGGRREEERGCCCCHVLEICADQCKDRRRRWGREGEIEKRRLKIDLTRGNYDSKRGVCTFESGSWPGFKKKKKQPFISGRSSICLQGCLSGYWVSTRDSPPPPPSSPLSSLSLSLHPPPLPHWRSIAVASVLIISNTDYLKGLLLL